MASFDGLRGALRFVPQSGWPMAIALTLLSIFTSTYVVTTVKSLFTLKSTTDGKEPPVVPYFLPYIGNTISFARDPASFVTSVT